MPDTSVQLPDPSLSAPPWLARLSPALRAGGLVAALCLVHAAAIAATGGRSALAVCYPATGLLAYALLVTRRRRWPHLALLGGAAGLAASVALGRPPLRAAGLELAVVAGAIATASLAVRVAGRPAGRREAGDRRAEEAARLAALGTLAAGVAHEINNPLSCVISNLSHLESQLSTLPDRDGSLRAEVLEPLAEAGDGARRVRDIVRQLGAFARADGASGPVDPGRALRAALALAGNEVRHRARVVTELEPTPPVIASEGRLRQVFLNLLVNAAQAIPDGSAERHEIRVALAARGDEVVVEVADTGEGLSEATRARIFEPFFTTRGPGAGCGLGLAIAHSIVTQLGGRLEVESAPGEGSRFRVALPAARIAPAPPPAPGTPAATGHAAPSVVAAPTPAGLRVLVVDDEPLVSRALARLLSGHEVVIAASGRDALARVRSGERFDAVICDLMMPELSGMDLHAAVARLAPALAGRFIFVTGGAFTDSAQEFLARAPNPRLDKPFDRAALHAALRDVAVQGRPSA